MKKIEVTIGFKYVDDNNEVVKIECDFSDNGYCYKDLSAWEKNEGIIYAPEYEFEDAEDEGECFIEKDDFPHKCWTRESWEKYVRGIVFYHNYEEIEKLSFDEKEKLIEWVAYNCLCVCDWQDLSTFLEGWDWEECIEEIIEEISKIN